MKTSRIFFGILAYSIFIIFCFMSISCGKKGAPTLRAYEKPDAPAELKAIHRENSIVLLWSHPKKDILKEFIVMKSSGSDFGRLISVSKDKNSYPDAEFKIENVYKYKIIAKTVKGVLSDDSEIIEVRPLAVSPAPKNLSFRIGNSNLKISWDDAGKELYYNIYKSYEKGKYSIINPLNSVPVSSTTFTDNIDTAQIVYYTVRTALNNDARDEGPASDEIEINPADFKPSKPAEIKTLKSENKIIILWKENPETWVAKYNIYKKTLDNGQFRLIGESLTPVFTDKEKMSPKQFYRVTAVGPVKESDPSETVIAEF